MIKKGVVSVDDQYAKAALENVVAIMHDKSASHAAKIAAAKVVLDFTKQKPASKTDVVVRKAEDFLNEIAGD